MFAFQEQLVSIVCNDKVNLQTWGSEHFLVRRYQSGGVQC